MTNKFTENAKQVISGAILSAKDLGHAYVGSEHLLLGITGLPDCTAAKLLSSVGIENSGVRDQIIGLAGMGSRTRSGGEDMTPKCKKILMKAGRISHDAGDDVVGTEHVLQALLSEECVAKRIVEMEGVSPEELSDILKGLYMPDGLLPGSSKPKPVKKRETPITDENARDLTDAARKDEIPLMTGREKEEERIIRILLRKTKNNPCLIGDAGVGKTAVVESLARRIADGNVPKELENKRIMSLEMSSVVAGTKYRGEFEEKLKKILSEAKSDPDMILFIDEIHTVVGAGSAEGSVDAANILKPSLARGEIRLIGATTPKEYKRSIERDPALERRFQPVNVREPNETECEAMLLAVKGGFEKHHKLKITDDAVREAIRISAKYIHDRYLPDKAIDLLDEAAAAKRADGKYGGTLTAADIDGLAEETTGIPLRTLTRSEADELYLLEEKLKKNVIGQDSAVSAICAAVRRAKTVSSSENRPLCSMLFSGSGGVGKTLCCKTLAECVFGGEKRLIRLDMSEYTEQHSISRLIGSPPGYVGFGDGGALTERVRHEPFSLVLFDGLEKAHPDVVSMVYDILDSGKLTDASGLEVSFRSAFVIITVTGSGGAPIAGFGGGKTAVSKPPSGIADRVDEVIAFAPLSADKLASIALKEADAFAARYNGDFKVDDSYVRHITEAAAKPDATARALCAKVRKDCGDAAATAFFSGEQKEITLSFPDGVVKSDLAATMCKK